MYFMPRTNRVCTFFAPMPSLYRYLTTSVFLTCLAAFWYFGIYCRLAGTMAVTSQAMTHSFAQNKNALITTQSESTLHSTLEQAQQAVTDYNKAWKTTGLELVLSAVTKAGLRFVSSEVTTKKNTSLDGKKGRSYIQDSVALQAVGTLKQCQQFFKLIAASGVDFACQKIDLAATENNIYSMSCVLSIITT